MKKLIILDCSIGTVHITNFDSNIYDIAEIQNFFDDFNVEHETYLKESECSWMLSEELNIKIH